jgi:predicted DNA-binding protein
MAVSVRLDPLLEKELELAAKRLGVTKSQFVISALEKALGRKNPYDLLLQAKAELGVDSTSRGDESGFKGDLADPDAKRAYIREQLRKKHGLGAS